MPGPLQRLLVLATLLGGVGLSAVAQDGGGAKKGEAKKEPAKAGEPAKKDGAKPAVEKTKLPPGAVIVVPSDFQKGLPIWPGFAVIPLEEYQKLKDAADKRPAKADKTLAHSCELTGRLDGDYVTLRAEFTFATQEPRTTVVLGLQNAQLSEKGELDGQPPLLGNYSAEDGFTVRVEEPGNHRLVLHLRVHVEPKRPGGGTRVERALELGLPGTVITTLALELPAAVKEVRCNDVPEKHRVPGKWFFALGKKQALTLLWREPVAQPGSGPHLAVDGKIKVGLAGTDATISAELMLEDPRGQTKECQLTLPAQASVEVEPPAGVAYELVPPSPANANYVLRFLEPSAEPWKVTAFVRVPRPAAGSRLAVGPFYVHGAEQQRGLITIGAPPEPRHQERLIYHRHGEVFQHDPPKGQPDVAAAFQYWGLPNPAKVKAGAPRVPLEVEIRFEQGALEAAVDQVLKLRSNGDGWQLDLAARLLVKATHGGGDFLDLQLPRPRPIGAAAFAVQSGLGFPATLPWPVLGLARGPLPAWAVPQDFQLSDERSEAIELPPVDGQGRCRVPLPRGLGKGYALTLTGRYAVAPGQQRVRVGLPRILGIREQGSKLAVQSDEALELLDGERGRELPVPEKHRYQYAVEETPLFVDVAWRRYRPEAAVDALLDVVMRGRTAEVRQRLTLAAPWRPDPSQPARLGQVELEVPAGIRRLRQVQGAELRELAPEHGVVWVTPQGEPRREVVLEYDLRLDDAADAGTRQLDLQALWPSRATQRSARVRVWCEPGVRVRPVGGAAWLDRGVEPVKDHDLLPALVLQGVGTQLPLTLQFDERAGSGVAALVCERGLIQADLGDGDDVLCRARYLVAKVNADAVELEFPARLALCQPSIRIGAHHVAWTAVDGTDERVARLPLPALRGDRPVVLEVAYRLPRSTQDGGLFGIATLIPPTFRDPVRINRLRWQVNLAGTDLLAVPLTPGARPDYRWGLHRWLLAPEPALSSAEVEAWLLGTGPAAEVRPLSLSFWPAGPEVQRVYCQPRLRLISVLSVTLVVLFVIVALMRPSRTGLVVLLGLAALGVLALAVVLPALLPPLFYGVQPGLVVVLLVAGLLWARQERYRRQLVFIPGFTRVKAGSSLVRNGRSSKRPRDNSTIDAPAPSGIAGPGPASSAKK